MSYIKIPVRSDVPAYEFQIDLDGKLYNLSFSWSERMQLWTMDMADENNVELLNGVQMFANFNLIGRFRDSRLPQKLLVCLDTAGENKDPGVDDFGSRVLLMYGDDT